MIEVFVEVEDGVFGNDVVFKIWNLEKMKVFK